MKDSILSLSRPNMGYRIMYVTLICVFHWVNITPTCHLWNESHFGRDKRYRNKRTGSLVSYTATMQNDSWTIDVIHDGRLESGGKVES